jgi:hypothetical protein
LNTKKCLSVREHLRQSELQADALDQFPWVEKTNGRVLSAPGRSIVLEIVRDSVALTPQGDQKREVRTIHRADFVEVRFGTGESLRVDDAAPEGEQFTEVLGVDLAVVDGSAVIVADLDDVVAPVICEGCA